jgi:hypothetical protein
MVPFMKDPEDLRSGSYAYRDGIVALGVVSEL